MEGMLINYAIVGHSQRRTQAEALANRLEATLHMDTTGIGCEANHWRAWNHHPKYADWTVVLEDDAIPCKHFTTHVEEELSGLPVDMMVSLYAGTSYPIQAQPKYQHTIAKGTPLITNNVYHAVGLAIPSHLIDSMLAHTQATSLPWDERINAWVHDQRVRVKYTSPSHVEHEDTKAVLEATAWQPRNKPRKAHNYCD